MNSRSMNLASEDRWGHFELSAKFENGESTADRVEIKGAQKACRGRGGEAKEGQGGGEGLVKEARGADENDMDMTPQIR